MHVASREPVSISYKKEAEEFMIARAASFAVCLLALSPAQRALAETDFNGELICNTAAHIDQPESLS
jgi:hypothetical protein